MTASTNDFSPPCPALAAAGTALRPDAQRRIPIATGPTSRRRSRRRRHLRIALRRLGRARRGGHRASARHARRHRDPEGRRLGGGRRDRRQRLSRLSRAHRLRHRRRLLRHALGSRRRSKVVGLDGSGRSPASLTLETVRARAPRTACMPALGAISVSRARRGRRLVDPAPALRQAALERTLRAGHRLRRRRRAGAADHRLLHQTQSRRNFTHARRRHRRDRQLRCAPGRPAARRRAKATSSAIPISPAPTG